MLHVRSASFVGPLCALLASCSLLYLTGCGMGTEATPDPVPLTVNGRVHGGQQPVVGAQIALYAAGNSGNGSAATSLLTKTVTSGSDGSFSITGDYSCPSPTTQVYLVATQGNPGLGSGKNNPALAMMAALGNCGDLSPSQFIWINEITTAAAAWALAPFAGDVAHIGASATNSLGLANAFKNAQLIADTSTGYPAKLSANLSTESGKINALADAVASCVNSDGTTGCQPLFSAATLGGGTAPADTWAALMNIVKNPGNNVAGVFAAIGPNPPFATTLTKAPNDWTLSLTVTGGGIASPESLAVDSQGNVWVADNAGGLSAVSPQGSVLSGSPWGAGVLSEDFGLAIDPTDNIWVTIEEQPHHNTTRGSVARFAGVSSGGTLGTSTLFSDNSINFPYAVAADTNGNIFVVNNSANGGSTNLVQLNPGTSTYTPMAVGQVIGFPAALAVDSAHGVWLPSTDGTSVSVAHVNASGSVDVSTACCGPVAAVALDATGNVWLANSENSDPSGIGTNGSLTELAPNGTAIQSFVTAGGITNPSHIAIDAGQNIWISNLHSTQASGQKYQTFSELNASATALSPSTGYGLDAQLLLPYALVVDPSGNVWISNTGGNSLVMFFGMATPTRTPLGPTPAAP